MTVLRTMSPGLFHPVFRAVMGSAIQEHDGNVNRALDRGENMT